MSSSGLEATLGGCMRLSSPSLGTVGRLLLPLALACCTAAATDKKLAMAPGDMGEPLLLWIKEAKEVNGLLEPPPLEDDSGSRKETETS